MTPVTPLFKCAAHARPPVRKRQGRGPHGRDVHDAGSLRRVERGNLRRASKARTIRNKGADVKKILSLAAIAALAGLTACSVPGARPRTGGLRIRPGPGAPAEAPPAAVPPRGRRRRNPVRWPRSSGRRRGQGGLRAVQLAVCGVRRGPGGRRQRLRGDLPEGPGRQGRRRRRPRRTLRGACPALHRPFRQGGDRRPGGPGIQGRRPRRGVRQFRHLHGGRRDAPAVKPGERRRSESGACNPARCGVDR